MCVQSLLPPWQVIITVEQAKASTVVVCDRAVARVLYAYLLGLDAATIPTIEIKGGILELRRDHSGFMCEHIAVADGAARDYNNGMD